MLCVETPLGPAGSPAEVRARALHIRELARAFAGDPAVPRWLQLATDLEARAADMDMIRVEKGLPWTGSRYQKRLMLAKGGVAFILY
jgi:hypothetical protein